MEEKLNQKSMEGMKELSPRNLQIGDYVSLYLDKEKKYYPSKVKSICGNGVIVHVLSKRMDIQVLVNDKYNKIYQLPIFYTILYICGAMEFILDDGKLRYDLAIKTQKDGTKLYLSITEESDVSYIITKEHKDDLYPTKESIEIPSVVSMEMLQHIQRDLSPSNIGTIDLIPQVEEHLTAYDEDGDSWNKVFKAIKK